MDNKLTLKLNDEIIEKAKKYAQTHNISLSRLIENYLTKIVSKDEPKGNITALVKSISGVIELHENTDYKSDYAQYLSEKY